MFKKLFSLTAALAVLLALLCGISASAERLSTLTAVR